MNTLCNGAAFSFRVKPEKVLELEALLSVMKPDPAGNHVYPMGGAKRLHYATWILLPEEKMPNEKMLPQRLMFLTTYWGTKKEHFAELAHLSPAGLHQLFSCCDGYSEKSATEKSVLNFLRKHSVSNSVYNAFQNATIDSIQEEDQLRTALESFLDKESLNPAFLQLPVVKIRERIQQHVNETPALDWAKKPWKKSFANYWAYHGPWIVLRGILVLIVVTAIFGFFHRNLISGIAQWLSLVFIVAAVSMLLLFRLNELKLAIQVKSNVTPPSDADNKKIADQECEMVCNEMTVTAPLKQGFIRPVFLFFLLTVARFTRFTLFIPTVHMARWLQVDGGRRIVFIAYFDNTSDGYAHDFVDSARRTKKVNLVLGNGDGYPYTKWAVNEGGKDANGYMNTVRKRQKLTNVWYSTHKNLSILNVLNNQRIRRGLWGEMKEDDVKKWLQNF